jgi:hypothetical protein
MGNRNLILAGVKGGGASGSALGMFAPPGTTLPTKAVGSGSALDVSFEDVGWCTEDGLKKAVDEATSTIKAFGSNAPVRKLVTSSETTFEITPLESNPTVIELYNRLPLGELTVAADGSFDFTEGEPRSEQYSAVFDLVDGPNRIRAVVPILEVTGRKEFNIKSAEAVQYGMTFTCYPGSDGVAIHWYYVVAGLATP